MSQDLHRRENAQTSGGRSWSRIAILFLLILCAGSLAVFVRKGHPPKAPLTTQTSAQPDAALEPTPGISTVSPQPSNSIPASASPDRKSTRLNSSHANISYAVFCLKKKNLNVLDHRALGDLDLQ